MCNRLIRITKSSGKAFSIFNTFEAVLIIIYGRSGTLITPNPDVDILITTLYILCNITTNIEFLCRINVRFDNEAFEECEENQESTVMFYFVLHNFKLH